MKKEKTILAEDIGFKKMSLSVDIEGTSPLICNKCSEKAKQELLATQMKKAKPKREMRKPDEEYKDSLYQLDNRNGHYGFPVMAIKKAMVRAGKNGLDIPMRDLMVAFHVKPTPGQEYSQLIEIIGEPKKRIDVVKLKGTTADLRYRAEFPKWQMKIEISYNPDMLSAEQLTYLLHLAGWSVGIGDWRPEKAGNFGTFKVKGMPD